MTVYNHFGGGPDDVTINIGTGVPVGSVHLTVWTALTGGSQITDLIGDLASISSGQVVSNAGPGVNTGRYSFRAPNTYGVIYMDSGSGVRWPLAPMETLALVPTAIAQAASASTAASAASTAAAAASSAAATANARSDDALAVANDALAEASRASDIAQAGASPYVEKVPLYSMGHSYTMYPSPYTTPSGGEYMPRIQQRLRMGPGWFKGRSATYAADNIGRMMSPSTFDTVLPALWTPGSRGICLIENMMNEVSTSVAGGDATFQDMWKRSLRSMMAIMSSEVLYPLSGATLTGTWTAISASVHPRELFPNADLRFATAIGAKAAFTVHGDTVWAVLPHSIAAYTSLNTLNVFVNTTTGTPFQVISGASLIGTMYDYTNSVTSENFSYRPQLVKITGLNAAAGTSGNKTLNFITTTANATYIAALYGESLTPPQIFVAKEPQRNPAAISAPNVTAFNANNAAYRAIVDAVCAERANAHPVDLYTDDWNNSTMVASLDVANNFHPNDLGMEYIASKFIEQILSVVTAPDPGVLTL